MAQKIPPIIKKPDSVDDIRTAAAIWPVYLPGAEVIAVGCPDKDLRRRYQNAYDYYLSRSRAGRIFKGKPCVYYAGMRWHIFLPVPQGFEPSVIAPSLHYLAEFQGRLKLQSLYLNNTTEKGDEILSVIQGLDHFPFTVYISE